MSQKSRADELYKDLILQNNSFKILEEKLYKEIAELKKNLKNIEKAREFNGRVFEYDIYNCPTELKGQLKIGDFS